MKKIVNYRPIPTFLLGVIIGILAFSFLSEIYLIVILIILTSAVIVGACAPKMRRYLSKIISFACAVAISILVTFMSYAAYDNDYVNIENCTVSGYVALQSEHLSGGSLTGATLFLRDVQMDTGRELDGIIEIDGEFPELNVGDKVTVSGDIFSKRLVVTDSFSLRDYRMRNYYRMRSVSVVSENINDATFTEKFMIATRSALIGGGGEDMGNLMYAMLYGDTAYVDYSIKSDFTLLGIAHIFAISGMNIAILGGFFVFILKKCRANNIFIFFFVGAVLFIYSMLCSFSSSVVRASVMLMIFLGAGTMGLRNDNISSLSLSAVVILFFEPIFLFDLSLLMSFGAVAGIIFFNTFFSRQLRFLPRSLANVLGSTIGVNIVLLPILLFYFGRLSLLFVVSNLILAPMLSLLFPAIVICAFTAVILPFMGFTITALGFLFGLLVKVNEITASIDFISVNFTVTSLFALFYFSGVIVLSPFVFAGRKVKRVIAFVLCAAVIVNAIISQPALRADKHIIGCAAAVREADYYHLSVEGTNYIIINGTVTTEGLRTINNYLGDSGIYRLDGIIKHSYSVRELSNFKYYYNLFNCDVLYVSFISSDYLSNLNVDYSETNDKIGLEFGKQYGIYIQINNFTIAFGANAHVIFDTDRYYDIIYSREYNPQIALLEPKYVIGTDYVNLGWQNAYTSLSEITISVNGITIKE